MYRVWSLNWRDLDSDLKEKQREMKRIHKVLNHDCVEDLKQKKKKENEQNSLNFANEVTGSFQWTLSPDHRTQPVSCWTVNDDGTKSEPH